MTPTIRIRDTVALLFVVALGAVGLGESILAGLHVPAARILVTECQGFEALATAGARQLMCGIDADAPPASRARVA